jgi:hypothetical protein
MLVMDIFGQDRRPAWKKIDRPTLVIASSESPLGRSEGNSRSDPDCRAALCALDHSELQGDTSRLITPPLIWAQVRKPLKCPVECPTIKS